MEYSTVEGYLYSFNVSKVIPISELHSELSILLRMDHIWMLWQRGAVDNKVHFSEISLFQRKRRVCDQIVHHHDIILCERNWFYF